MARREGWKGVGQMAGRAEIWRSGLEAGYQRGRLIMEQWARKGIGRGRIVFLFRMFERFCAQARMFQHKHAPDNGGERGGASSGGQDIVTFPESAMMPSAPPCPSGADSSIEDSEKLASPPQNAFSGVY